MTFSIAITTTDRDRPTLGESILSLNAVAQWHDVTISIVKDTEPKRGCFGNYYFALSEVARSNADVVAVLPDDMVYHTDLFSEVSKAITGAGYCAAYTPRGCGNRYRMKRGWNEVKGGWATTWGGCYFYPIEVARQVVEHPYIIDHRDNYEPNAQIDHAIPEVMHRMGMRQLWAAPSLCRHIGMTSTIGHKHTLNEEPYRPH